MHFVYPAVFYKDQENDNYVVAFDDVNIFCSEKTVEEAFLTAKRLLKEYIKLSIKMYEEVQETPRTYLESAAIHKNDIVLLIDAEFKKIND